MNTTALLLKQTRDAYEWVNKLTDSVPMDLWRQTPSGIHTNVCWQVGHLIVSYYFHTIMVITGHRPEILMHMPMKEYGAAFTNGSPSELPVTVQAEMLKAHLAKMAGYSLKSIRTVCEEQLGTKLSISEIQHPVATTVYEALDWNIKHTMWHCGQLGLLKRALNGRWEFGLRQ